ncbi:EF-hand domain-containing protein [Pseudoroseicyclus sp. CXY001]|uniref:EF-hand domain-containing protein n=1 Tax=Pseudoroseicyclus sp. CXY001 TaxID=3242492 RepID=UPI00358DD090
MSHTTKLTALGAALLALATPALAQDEMVTETDPMGAETLTIETLDTDADGWVSMAELAAVYPETGEEVFSAADANADGYLDAEELEAAVAAGLFDAPAE